MNRIILVLCIVIALTASARAGQLFSCTDRDGNPVVTSIPQDGMENCVLKSTFKDSSTADTGMEGAAIADASTTGDTAGTATGTVTGTGTSAGTAGTATDKASPGSTAGSTGAAKTGITASGKGIAETSETTGTTGTTGITGSGTTRGSSATRTKKELR